jgi:hypothetical protein
MQDLKNDYLQKMVGKDALDLTVEEKVDFVKFHIKNKKGNDVSISIAPPIPMPTHIANAYIADQERKLNYAFTVAAKQYG